MTDSWKRTKLNGKVSDLPDRISSVLNVPLDGYICNERSYWDLKRLEKILEDAKSLQKQSLKEKLTTNNRTKRCVLSDSKISPCVSGPSKSLRHAMDQGFDVIISATIFARQKSAGGGKIRGLGPRNDVLTTCKAVTQRGGQRIITVYFSHTKWLSN